MPETWSCSIISNSHAVHALCAAIHAWKRPAGDLQVGIDALAGIGLAEIAAAHLEGRLRLVAQRAQHARNRQAAFPEPQVPRLQRAAHAPVVQDAVAHLPAHAGTL